MKLDLKESSDHDAEQAERIPVLSNTVALIGLILAVLAALLCVLLFLLIDRLPSEISVFQEQLNQDRPAQLRLLILGCSTAVLTVVALILCVVGLFVQNRPRLLAAVGTTISLVLLLGIFGVLLVGSIMNPAPQAPEPPVPAPAEASPFRPLIPQGEPEGGLPTRNLVCQSANVHL